MASPNRRAGEQRARERLSALAHPPVRVPVPTETPADRPLLLVVPPVGPSASGDVPSPDVARADQDSSPEAAHSQVVDMAGSPGAVEAPAPGPGPDPDADDLLARLRSGALATAATAYTAANGHPLEHPDLLDVPTRRWRVSVRSAVIVALVLLVVAAVVVLRGWTSSSAAVVPFDDGAAVSDPFAESFAGVVVHVVGEVSKPGVVELVQGARVAEAVEAAGGATGDAALGSVNLARVVEDGEQILVPSLSAPENATEADDGVPGAGQSDPRLDLNAADAAAFELLPGIGPVLAERIVAWRADHGRFSSVDELAEVSGIGPSLLGRLRDLVRVG